MRKDLTLQQKLDGLLEYAVYFDRPDADFGEWVSSSGQMPYTKWSRKTTEFVKACYELGWLERFDWGSWAWTEEAVRLRDDPDALEEATDHQISRILTVLLRQDRFAEGSLLQSLESGYMQRVLRRIAALAAE